MTSSPDLNDVVGDVNKTKSGLNSRKSSDLSPERNYHKNGTGLMRDGSIDGNIHFLFNILWNLMIEVLVLLVTTTLKFAFELLRWK